MQIGFSRAILLGSISLAAITLPTTTTHADELVLSNGDVLQGQTVEQTESHLMWHSDNFGNLSIALETVASINGKPLVKIKAPTTARAAFSRSYKGGLSLTGAYASGNEEREDWDIESAVEWRIGDGDNRQYRQCFERSGCVVS